MKHKCIKCKKDATHIITDIMHGKKKKFKLCTKCFDEDNK